MLPYSQVGGLASAVKTLNILITFIMTLERGPSYKKLEKDPTADNVLEPAVLKGKV